MIETGIKADIIQTERLVDTVQKLSLARNIKDVMAIVRKVARELTGADGATFVLKDNNMCYYADEDAISPLWKGSRFPMKTCISGWVMMNKKPAVIGDIYSDDRIPFDAYRPTFVKSLVMVPIRTIDPIGAIGNYWAVQHNPSPQEVALLQALADITAVSVENINYRNQLIDRLSERKKMLVQLEKQKEQLEEFTQMISHNLRAPLSNLQLLNDMIYKSNDLDSKLRYVGKQKKVVDLLLETFEELVDATNVRTNLPLKNDNFKLEECAEKAMGLLQGEILESGAEIIHDFSSVKFVFFPKKYLDSIIFNLLSNALRYRSPERQPKIYLKSYRRNGWLFLEISDNGRGIDLNKHGDKIFKLHKTFHKHPLARGFGLFITRTQVEAMGGTISVQSKYGEGTKFIVKILPNNFS